MLRGRSLRPSNGVIIQTLITLKPKDRKTRHDNQNIRKKRTLIYLQYMHMEKTRFKRILLGYAALCVQLLTGASATLELLQYDERNRRYHNVSN
jgi:hypothetical protein